MKAEDSQSNSALLPEQQGLRRTPPDVRQSRLHGYPVRSFHAEMSRIGLVQMTHKPRLFQCRIIVMVVIADAQKNKPEDMDL
jgi:hypothetical protein